MPLIEPLPASLQLFLNRRSCRAYLPEPLPSNHLEWLCEVLRWTPSAGNRQPWHFYVILNDQIKQALSHAARQSFLMQAPLVFVICALPEQSAARYGARGRELYVLQDTAAAVQNLLLAATALDYGTCWVGAFDEQEVQKVLNLSPERRPVALVPVGKPSKMPAAPSRLNQDKIVTVLE
ncbi:MAG: nitroreductase family protein [Calditrichia bacterium]